MKVAIVHDFLLRLGGAERVVLELKNIFPQAPIYTLLYNKQKMKAWFNPADIQTSWLQKIPKPLRIKHKYLLRMMPLAIESFDLSDYDLVISSSTAFAKGIVTRTQTRHICYCHSPAGFLWDKTHSYLEEQGLGWFRRQLASHAIHRLRLWDKSSAKRVDKFIANSQTTQKRISKFYRRQSTVIYPPIPLWQPAAQDVPQEDYFLIVSQLTKYKNIDIAIEAFNKLGLPLYIVGEGPQRKELEKLAGPTIKFLGFLSDGEVAAYMKNCLGFVFAGEDDFGIAPVQAMKFGKPVLALRAGGAMETVAEGVSGEFFDDPVPEVLADGVRRILDKQYDKKQIIDSVSHFSDQQFKKDFLAII